MHTYIWTPWSSACICTFSSYMAWTWHSFALTESKRRTTWSLLHVYVQQREQRTVLQSQSKRQTTGNKYHSVSELHNWNDCVEILSVFWHLYAVFVWQPWLNSLCACVCKLPALSQFCFKSIKVVTVLKFPGLVWAVAVSVRQQREVSYRSGTNTQLLPRCRVVCFWSRCIGSGRERNARTHARTHIVLL